MKKLFRYKRSPELMVRPTKVNMVALVAACVATA